MQKHTSRHQAQIGVVAVLLTTVLLAVGLSVTSRVTRQVTQDTQRTESSQTYNIAESSADSGQAYDYDDGFTYNTTAVDSAPGTNTIYLEAGESVEINLDELGRIGTDNRSKPIYWEYTTSTTPTPCYTSGSNISPALLISYYPADGSTVEYHPVHGYNCSTSHTALAGYEPAESSDKTNFRNKYSALNKTGGIIRIKALYAGTYVSMENMTTVTRAASSNEGGNEVRVSEQNETHPTAPSIFDFGIFVAQGSITQ